MAVKNAMFLFEVVVENVKSYVESRFLVIKSEFDDIFALELMDPKHMYIVIPDPPPLPPEPVGKKGKKKKPKPKKKKGKKGKIELPPPEPIIQSGQSVLFTSSAEFLIQSMKKFPMELSLWAKEDGLMFIGSATVPWDPAFITYLERIVDCQEPPSMIVRDSYNIFQEGTAKMMATLGLQVKLSHLTHQVTTSFRSLSEDPGVKKFLYTGMNSKTTSYMCTYKTTDEDFEANSNKIENNYVTDRPKPKPAVFADYKNAPGVNVTFFNEGDYCCMGHADKPPESIYKAPETCPDIDFISDYVRKIITSCNDNMRMLTPRPTIRPRIKATDIDRLCYCREKNWPEGELAERFKKEMQREPCPLCIKGVGKNALGRSKSETFNIANIRGPCGRPDCRIARDMRAYIENLYLEDNEEVNIEEIFGPCGSKSCTLAEKIQQFLRHEGPFAHGATQEGLQTQCACLKQMQDALTKREDCDSECSNDCAASSSEVTPCGGKGCPYKNRLDPQQVYHVYYFTVEHDFDKEGGPSSQSKSPQTASSPKDTVSGSTSPSGGFTSKYKYCSENCPSKLEDEPVSCSKSACYTGVELEKAKAEKCMADCPGQMKAVVSPADSEIIIKFDDIRNPCCVKSCNIADTVKDFIVEGIDKKKKPKPILARDDPCYCDCECSFKFSKKTTYCAVCGGYECLGDDMALQPEYAKPHPCPIYHKLYDKKGIQVKSPWPEEDQKNAAETQSMKSGKTSSKQTASAKAKDVTATHSAKNMKEKKEKIFSDEKLKKKKKKKVGKFKADGDQQPSMSDFSF